MQQFIALLELRLHQLAWITVSGHIAHRQVYTFFDDQLIAADIYHIQTVLLLHGTGAFILAPDGVEQNAVGLFRKGQKAQLGIIEEPVDKMKLYQHLLAKKLGAVEKYFVVFKIIDILYLE